MRWVSTRPDPTSQMAPPRRPGHQVSSSSHYLCPRRNLPVPLTGYGRSGASARPRAIRLLPVASTPQVGVSAPSATSLIYPRTGGRGECAQTCVRSPLGVLRSTGTRGVVRKSGSRPRCIVVMCCVRRYRQATLAGLPAGPRRRGPPCGAPYLIYLILSIYRVQYGSYRTYAYSTPRTIVVLLSTTVCVSYVLYLTRTTVQKCPSVEPPARKKYTRGMYDTGHGIHTDYSTVVPIN